MPKTKFLDIVVQHCFYVYYRKAFNFCILCSWKFKNCWTKFRVCSLIIVELEELSNFWHLIIPIFSSISFWNFNVLNSEFVKSGYLDFIPVIKAHMTVWDIFSLILACLQINAFEPFINTTIISPFSTLFTFTTF